MGIKENWNAITNLMDDETREIVHWAVAPCSEEELLKEYICHDPGFAITLKTEFGIEMEPEYNHSVKTRYGKVIACCHSLNGAKAAVRRHEAVDRDDGSYIKDFYTIYSYMPGDERALN